MRVIDAWVKVNGDDGDFEKIEIVAEDNESAQAELELRYGVGNVRSVGWIEHFKP